MKRLFSLISIGLSAMLLTACLNVPPSDTSLSPSPVHSETLIAASPSPSLEPINEPEQSEATLLAVGDVMAHMPQLPAYYNSASKRYSLSSWFTQVKPILRQGDWVIGNLETPIAGRDLKYSGFPRFNAPIELAEAVADVGIQLVSTANNHAMDRGFPGVARTLTNVRKAGLIPVGTSASAQEQQRIVIEERNGIRMGFLAYTYGTNGIPVPANKAFAVNMIDVDVIKEDIARLRQAEADIVTVSLHFGVEYQRLPNKIQTGVVRELFKSGADIVLGSHPHVVQPYEEIDIPASESHDGLAHRGIVIYSLGNFISNQKGNWKDVGLIFGVHLIKTHHSDGTSSTRWDKVTTEPTWVHILWKNQKRYYTVIPLRSALANKNIPNLTAKDYDKMKTLLKGIDRHLLKFHG
ncbi:CapA family protein [Cohnella silvisoli]|uniref:CapA family protein n=1 Tax=Cohnella silvisoli TaxID=2873699 RepID=A0ABV1KNG3_9BACL|nr:CapA family protein [Cohnella silvisoli]MCD9021081.1 CapA family protein [Cohnella silvisoli]